MTVHHSAGPGQTFDTVRSIAYQHVWSKTETKDEWPGIGYAFCINNKGYIWQVNELETWSFHAGTSDGNRNHIGVCLLGNFTSVTPTDAQIQAAVNLHAYLCLKLGRQIGVTKHRDFKGTACPGATWPQWYGRIAGEPVAPVPEPPTSIDLLPYLRGDGRGYMVRHPVGNEEKFRTVHDGNRWQQLKNSQYEEFLLQGDFVLRGLDTSAGEGNYYRQFEFGQQYAKWCPRTMAIGQTWVSPDPHTVQTYRKSDCQPVVHERNGTAVNRVTLVARHTSRIWNGIVVNDVIELRTHTGESMFFSRGWGLVAWGSDWGSSAISKVLPPNEWDNQLETGCFS